MTIASLSLAILLALMGAHSAMSQGVGAPQTPTPPAQATPPAPRPTPPTRDPHTPGYVAAKELPDGAVPPPNADGNFILGPTHNPAPEMSVPEGGLQGRVVEFTMSSADSKFYPGMAREPNTRPQPDPADP